MTREAVEKLQDATAMIRVAVSVLEGDLTEVEAQRDEIARVLLRAVEAVEEVVT
jgi:hypothetical protein